MKIILFILLGIVYFQNAAVTNVTNSLDANVEMSMRNFTKANTAWHVYIRTMTYDIVRTIFLHVWSVGSWPYDIPQSLIEFSGALPHAYRSRFPCQFTQIVDMSVFRSLSADSKLCGKISTVFSVLGIPNVRELTPLYPYEWTWFIKVNGLFRINTTFLHMESTLHPNCKMLNALLFDAQAAKAFGIYCPGNAVKSFYSHGDTVIILLTPVRQLRQLFHKNNFIYDDYGSCSFIYELLDNKFYVTKLNRRPFPEDVLENRLFIPIRKSAHGKAYATLLGYGYVDTGNVYANISIPTQYNPIALEEFIIFKEASILIHEIRSLLGDALSVSYGQLGCVRSKAHVLFYDGTYVDLLSVDRLLSRIHTWDCTNDERILGGYPISSSIGDLLVVAVLSGHSNWTVETTFTIGFRTIFPHSELSKIHTFFLNQTHRSKTISVNMKNTFMHVIAVRPDIERSGVEMVFENITYKGYVQVACSYGGMYILRFVNHVGSVCSSKVAQILLRTYRHVGMHLEHEALIVFKQYYELSSISANITFFISNCPGFFQFYTSLAVGRQSVL